MSNHDIIDITDMSDLNSSQNININNTSDSVHDIGSGTTSK